jgi:hypothetical protein
VIQVDRETSPNRDEVKKTQHESCYVLVGDEPVEHDEQFQKCMKRFE